MRGIEANLLAGWRTLWNATAAIANAVPGGLWLDRVPEDGANGQAVATPYAEITVRPADAEYCSGGKFLQSFAVEVSVWSNAGPVDGGTIQAAIGAAFDPPAGGSVPSGLTVANATPIRVDQVAGKFELDPARAKSKDILVATAAWNVILWIPR
jgi:hypothetical protein